MIDPRTEKIVAELKETIERLNRIDSILQRMDVRYHLGRSRIDEPWKLEEIVQSVRY